MPPSWRKAWVRSARFSPLPGVRSIVPEGAASAALEWSTLAELEADDEARLEDDALVEEVVGVGVVDLRVVVGGGGGCQVEVGRQVVVGLGGAGAGAGLLEPSENSQSP